MHEQPQKIHILSRTPIFAQIAPMIELATARTATNPATIRIGFTLFSLALPPSAEFSLSSLSLIEEEIPLLPDGSLSVCFTVLSSSPSFNGLELNKRVEMKGVCNRCWWIPMLVGVRRMLLPLKATAADSKKKKAKIEKGAYMMTDLGICEQSAIANAQTTTIITSENSMFYMFNLEYDLYHIA